MMGETIVALAWTLMQRLPREQRGIYIETVAQQLRDFGYGEREVSAAVGLLQSLRQLVDVVEQMAQRGGQEGGNE